MTQGIRELGRFGIEEPIRYFYVASLYCLIIITQRTVDHCSSWLQQVVWDHSIIMRRVIPKSMNVLTYCPGAKKTETSSVVSFLLVRNAFLNHFLHPERQTADILGKQQVHELSFLQAAVFTETLLKMQSIQYLPEPRTYERIFSRVPANTV